MMIQELDRGGRPVAGLARRVKDGERPPSPTTIPG